MPDPTLHVGHYDNWPHWMLRWWQRTLEQKIARCDAEIARLRAAETSQKVELQRRANRAAHQLNRHAHLLAALDCGDCHA